MFPRQIQLKAQDQMGNLRCAVSLKPRSPGKLSKRAQLLHYPHEMPLPFLSLALNNPHV